MFFANNMVALLVVSIPLMSILVSGTPLPKYHDISSFRDSASSHLADKDQFGRGQINRSRVMSDIDAMKGRQLRLQKRQASMQGVVLSPPYMESIQKLSRTILSTVLKNIQLNAKGVTVNVDTISKALKVQMDSLKRQGVIRPESVIDTTGMARRVKDLEKQGKFANLNGSYAALRTALLKNMLSVS
ncbi:hypothetical protein K7432_004911 [Basidiobolus ranarum]|uniref:Uncharacterized protein n=1 Tax=Basidiobolus ranarum TaxID=34480 RepID=A0ABR2W3X5_9FUNG